MRSLTLFLALGILVICLQPGSAAEFIKVTGRLLQGQEKISFSVGARRMSHSGRWLAPGARAEQAAIRFPDDAALLVRVVVADDQRSHHLAYTVDVDGRPVQKRELLTRGVGRRSQFVILPRSASGRHTVSLQNTGPEKLFLEGALLLGGYRKQLAQAFPDDDFILSVLVSPGRLSPDVLERLKGFDPAPGLTRALSAEFHYAARSPEDLAASAEAFKASADALGWPVVVIPCSWWAGTPPEVLARPEFQQVCYSPTDTLDEGPKLKALLGPAWSLQYGWTVPNIWSNTPWQTMNNAELNALRKARLDAGLPSVVNALGGRIRCFITENEPMYWAGDFPDGNYPVARKDLMADFNPHTVARAAKDGVTLNPTDGLSDEERWWLYRNLQRYIAETAGWIAAAAKGKPVYTHAQVDEQFPMKYTSRYRPNMELAVSPRFPTGVEMLWDTDLQALQRMREWGSWGLINREEGDSRPISQHIAMAAASYAMGADILNSYNWLGLRPPDALRYFNGFIALLKPSHASPPAPARWTTTGRISWRLPENPDMPWFTQLDLPLANPSPQPVTLTLEVRQRESHLLAAWAQTTLPPHCPQKTITISLNSMTDAAQGQPLVCNLRASGPVQIGLTSSGAPAATPRFIPAEERHRSRIIQRLEAR